jgi:hypothetical protein
MQAEKLQVKLFATAPGAAIAQTTFIPIFHDWIKRRALPELMIDVANYAHVPRGPGVALIGHCHDYFVDDSDGRRGLLCSRKREAPAPEVRLADVFRRAIFAGQVLEREPAVAGTLAWRTDELLFRINDRLAAPNDATTFAQVKPELEALGRTLFAGAAFALTPAGSAKELFSVRITTRAPADLGALLARLGGAPDPGA